MDAFHISIRFRMLYSFVQHQRNKKDKDDLHVFYCVAGVTQDNSKKVTEASHFTSGNKTTGACHSGCLY